MTDISQTNTINSVVVCKVLMVQILKSVGSIPHGKNNGHMLTNSSTKNVSCHVYVNYLTVSRKRKKVQMEKNPFSMPGRIYQKNVNKYDINVFIRPCCGKK